MRHAPDADDRSTPGDAAQVRAQVLAGLGRLDEAQVEAAGARDSHRGSARPDELAHACWLHARILGDLGRVDDAVAAYDAGVAAATRPQLLAELTVARAGLLAGTARAAEAIDPLVEEIGVRTASGRRDETPPLQHQLAIAYLNADRPLDAAEVAEEALAAFRDAGDDHVYPVHELLAAVYDRLDQPDAVVEQLEAISDRLRADDASGPLGEVLERIAEIRDRQDRDGAAAAGFAAAGEAYGRAGRPVDRLRAMRQHATSSLWAGQPDAALAALAAADGFAADLPADDQAAEWERAVLDHDAARVLVRLDRAEEAVTRAREAVRRFRGVEGTVQAAYAGMALGDLLANAGRPAEAADAFRAARDELPSGNEAGHERIRAALDRLAG